MPIIQVNETADCFEVQMGNGDVAFAPKSPANSDLAKVNAWIAAGGVVQASSGYAPAEFRRLKRNYILNLHGQVLQLERELSQNPGASVALQNRIDDAQTRIDALRPQT